MKSINEKISNYFQYDVELILNGEIQRFGPKKEFWAVGRQWIYKNKTYFQVKYGNFKDPDIGYKTINSWENQEITPNESRSIRKNTEELNAKIKAQRAKKYEDARETYAPIFEKLAIGETHDYLRHKSITSNFTARVADIDFPDSHIYKGTLCVPVYNSKRQLTGLQRIFRKENTFEKRYTPGLELKGSICPLKKFSDAPLIYLTEGFATAASIQMAIPEIPVIACFQASNIAPAIKTIRAINPKIKIVIAADRDINSENVGEKYAKKAAEKNRDVIYRVVKFPEGSPSNWSDFNDLHCFVPGGLEKIKAQLSVNLKEFENEQFKNDIENGFTFEDDETGKLRRDYHRLLAFLKTKYRYKFFVDEKRFYLWKGTHYEGVDDQFFKSFAQKYFNYPKCEKETERREFLTLAQASENVGPEFFAYRHGLINLQNGVYDYLNCELIPHDPENGFNYVVPIEYDPDAICPIWNELLKNLTCGRLHLQNVIEEFIGFAMSNMPHEKHNKAMVFEGSGSNGKSTLIRAIESLLGAKNCSYISISEINVNRFLTGFMDGKLANFSEEEPKKAFSQTGQFKKLTGGTPIFVEEKGKPGRIIENRTKLFLSYNEIPFLNDASLGMKRRLIIVPFELNLERHPELMIEFLAEKIQMEKPGILLNILRALKRLNDNGKFTYVPESEEKVESMIKNSDSVREWFDEYVEPGLDEDYISSREAFASFKEFTGVDNPKIQANWFSRRVMEIAKEKGLNSSPFTKSINGNKFRALKGLRLKVFI